MSRCRLDHLKWKKTGTKCSSRTTDNRDSMCHAAGLCAYFTAESEIRRGILQLPPVKRIEDDFVHTTETAPHEVDYLQ